MTIEIFNRGRDATLVRALTLWLCRIAALGLVALGLFYWTRLVGIREGALWRFDLMPTPWMIVTPMLAVLYPIAGVGLWMTVSWGAVVWIIVALVEGAMLFGFPSDFGGDPSVFIVHACGLVLLGALRVTAMLGARAGNRV